MACVTVLLLSAALRLGAQGADPLDYFPHHTGDTWEYTDGETGRIFYTRTLGSDTVNAGGDTLVSHYYQYGQSGSVSRGWYYIDSLDNVYTVSNPDSTHSNLSYVLNARVGDRWHVRTTDTTNWAEVIERSTVAVFGRSSGSITTEYYREVEGSQQWEFVSTLAAGFGLVKVSSHPSGYYYLSGAIINGKRYGSLASVDDGSLSSAALAAAPNPFLGGTVISYSVDHPARVRLSLHNMLGREVACLYDGPREAGAYRAGFDGACLPAGAYIVRLLVDDALYHTTLQLVR